MSHGVHGATSLSQGLNTRNTCEFSLQQLAVMHVTKKPKLRRNYSAQQKLRPQQSSVDNGMLRTVNSLRTLWWLHQLMYSRTKCARMRTGVRKFAQVLWSTYANIHAFMFSHSKSLWSVWKEWPLNGANNDTICWGNANGIPCNYRRGHTQFRGVIVWGVSCKPFTSGKCSSNYD